MLVVDDQYALRRLSGGRRSICRRAFGGRPLARCERQTDDKLAAAAAPITFGLDGAAVKFDQLPRQRESDAETPAIRLRGRRPLHVEIKNAWEHLMRDADAVVANAQHCLAILSGRAQLDTPACRRVLS